ncbi:DBH-like monooxygenase protein 1 homolog [Clavelina lepadiformis]|uniref:DBH-like monooxygenase protein 1 homolog n=1 Tax=Clavelina lepadiformis TaxID=159417 RepID=UPI0040417D4B
MRILIYLLACLMCFAHAQTPSEEFPHMAALAPGNKVVLYWKFNDTHITFELHGQTTGWVGVGLSPNGGMIDADIYVGWVKDGKANITDRMGLPDSQGFPPLDEKQNIELLDGSEADGWTRLKFRREIPACESTDLAITTDTTRVIYALGAEDPSGDDIVSADYHQVGLEKRGTRSLLILESNGDVTPPAGETYETFELLNGNLTVPQKDTYYNCRLFEFPTLSSKHHMVKIEPVIQAGNELHVHHILLYQCNRNVLQNSSTLLTNEECYTPNMPPDFINCNSVFHGWAIGGGTFHYPNHAGFPLGTEDSPRYVVMETHYDNPQIKSDIQDNSGLRITYTSQLRDYDAAVIEVGHSVSPYEHLIPPNAESFLSHGNCHHTCLKETMAYNNQDSIKIFGSFLHSHLLGREMTLRHFRGNKELPFIARDQSYDFNYQEAKIFSKEIEIKSGDSMQVVCNYNSKQRANFTTGGLGTQQEMCLSYVYYYPKIPLFKCLSNPTMASAYGYFGVTSYRFTASPSVHGTLNDILIMEPAELAGKRLDEVVTSTPWDETRADTFSAYLRDAKQQPRCETNIPLNMQPSSFYAERIVQPYVPPEKKCGGCVTLMANAALTVMTMMLGLFINVY